MVRESQVRATKKWEEKNREHSNYIKNKSGCKSFIKNKSTLEDLEQIELLIKERRETLLK